MARVLRWDIYNNPVLSDGALYLNLDEFETTQARYSTLRLGGLGDGALELIDVSKALARDAVKNWLMKEVRFTAPNGAVPYAAFIGEVTVEYGYAILRRRVNWIGNRVIVRYMKRGNTSGRAKRRLYVEDTESQQRFGLRTLRIDLTDDGFMSPAQATARASVLLNKYKNFTSRARVALPRRPRVRLALWSRWMTTNWNDVTLRFAKAKKISAITQSALASCQFVTADYADVNDVGTSVRYNSKAMTRVPQEIIMDVLPYGDSATRRLCLQIWDDGIPHLKSAPTTIGLYANTDDARVWGDAHSPLPNWAVRAGDYMMLEDWDDALDVLIDATADERAVLIEKTDYNALTDDVEAEAADMEGVASVMGKARRGRRVVVA